MKKIFILGLYLLSGWGVFAQEQPDPEVAQDPKVQEKIKNLRIAYISDKLGLTPEQAEKFWPVYREFSDKRREIRQEFVESRKEIKQDNPDQAKQEELVKLGLALKQRELDLEKIYSERLLKVITAQQILNLRRAEGDFQRIILEQIQQRRTMQQRNENIRERNQQLKQRN
jgi:Spy/CpxP family protein refolding chaperone